MERWDADVLIVGAGPVGLFMANECLRLGLSCHIIDKKKGLSDKSKALGLHIRSLEMLDDVGLYDEFQAKGYFIEGITIKSDSKVLMEANFAQLASRFKKLMIIPQSETEALFLKALQVRKEDVQWQHTLTSLKQAANTVAVVIEDNQGTRHQKQYSLVLGCDGAHSTVRQLAGLDFKGEAYKKHWWLADVQVAWQNDDKHLWIYANEAGPLGCFPMGCGQYRVVMEAPSGKSPNLADIQKTMSERVGEQVALSEPQWISAFTISHRQVEHYRVGRIFLLGDSAHIHSPLGGQGLNTGLQDAYNLAWKLSMVQKGHAKESLLDSYHLERHPVGEEVLALTDTMTKMITLKNPALIFMRNRALRFLGLFECLKNKITHRMAEFAVNYQTSPIVKGCKSSEAAKLGYFLPDRYFYYQGASLHLSQILRGHFFSLLIFCNRGIGPSYPLQGLVTQLKEKNPELFSFFWVSSADKAIPHWSEEVLVDKSGENRKKLYQTGALMCVRPDKYVSFISNGHDVPGLKAHLNQLLNLSPSND